MASRNVLPVLDDEHLARASLILISYISVNAGARANIQAHVCLVRSRNEGILAQNPCSGSCLANGVQNFLADAGKYNHANHAWRPSRGNDAFPRAAQRS